MRAAEREPDDEIVQAEDEAAEQQLPAASGGDDAGLVPGRAEQAVEPDPDQQRGRQPVPRRTEHAGCLCPDRQPDHRHAGLEQPEHQADPQPDARIHAGDPDRHRSSEVRRPDRGGHQQQGQHAATVAHRAGLRPGPD